MTHILDSEGGHVLPEKAVRVTEIIQDFNPDLEVRWIPPQSRNASDTKPFAIWHSSPRHPDGGYFVMFLSEEEMDHRVVAKLFQAQNTSLSDIDAENAARKAVMMKERMDALEDELEFQKFVIESKTPVKHNGVVYR